MRTLGKKNGKEIKIVRENYTSYTFLDNGIEDIAAPSDDDKPNKITLNLQKDIVKTRSLNSKKTKIRYKHRITGGQTKQGHTSVYE